MADSAPDPKVEDVLSSVRRLVSQEIPKREVPKPAAPDAGALVLTPKDRIEADPKARLDTRSLEERIAELEAAVDSTATEFEPDGSEDQAMHRPDRIVFTRPRPGEEARRRRTTLRLSEIALIETGPANEAEEAENPPVAFRHEPSRPRSRDEASVTDEAPIAEDVPTLPPAPAELHAFSDDPDDVVARIEARIERGEEVQPAPPEAVSEPEPTPETDPDDSFDAALIAAVAASKVSKPSPEELPEEEQPEEEDSVGQAEPPDVSVELAETEPVEKAISGPADTTHRATPLSEPAPVADAVTSAEANAAEVPSITEAPATDAQTPEASVGTEEPATDTQTPEAPVQPEPTAEAVAEAALNALPTEEALRLLVARLMREELQGKLGERITQNVRKLVRREMKRVLEARNLD